jgi:hypothetical protein
MSSPPLSAGTAALQEPLSTLALALDGTDLDWQVQPGEDFDQFVNGKWKRGRQRASETIRSGVESIRFRGSP